MMMGFRLPGLQVGHLHDEVVLGLLVPMKEQGLLLGMRMLTQNVFYANTLGRPAGSCEARVFKIP
jgi:hypothetical protein